MDVSKFLGKVVGIYLIIVSLAMLVNMDQFAHFVDQLITDAPLMFVTGFFTLIIGVLMVVAHNIWRWDWRVIITIIGWLTLLKALSLIFYPQFIDAVSVSFVKNLPAAYITAVVDLVLGLIIVYFGFRNSKHSL